MWPNEVASVNLQPTFFINTYGPSENTKMILFVFLQVQLH